MKDKIFVFIIGVLIGAILATGIFFIYEKKLEKELKVSVNTNSETEEDMMFMMDGEMPPPPPEGENGEILPPQKPE